LNAVSEDVTTILDAVSPLVFGEDLFFGRQPTSPDKCLFVSSSGGVSPETQFNWQRPTFQILARGDRGDYKSAVDILNVARAALHAITNMAVGSTRYIGIYVRGDMIDLAHDEEDRPLVALNFQAHRTG